jgi:hypothetical protein
MSKKNHVEEQKGPINPHQTNYRFQSEMQTFMEDRMHGQMRRDGQTMELHEPKQTRK